MKRENRKAKITLKSLVIKKTSIKKKSVVDVKINYGNNFGK